jgi:hypothetical protein
VSSQQPETAILLSLFLAGWRRWQRLARQEPLRMEHFQSGVEEDQTRCGRVVANRPSLRAGNAPDRSQTRTSLSRRRSCAAAVRPVGPIPARREPDPSYVPNVTSSFAMETVNGGRRLLDTPHGSLFASQPGYHHLARDPSRAVSELIPGASASSRPNACQPQAATRLPWGRGAGQCAEVS